MTKRYNLSLTEDELFALLDSLPPRTSMAALTVSDLITRTVEDILNDDRSTRRQGATND